MKTHIAVAASALLLASGTTAPAIAKDAAPPLRNQCFWTRNADGFAAADEHTLNVRVGVRDVYQFEMFGACQGLDWDQHIALVSRSGSTICTGMDAEVISQAPGFGR